MILPTNRYYGKSNRYFSRRKWGPPSRNRNIAKTTRGDLNSRQFFRRSHTMNNFELIFMENPEHCRRREMKCFPHPILKRTCLMECNLNMSLRKYHVLMNNPISACPISRRHQGKNHWCIHSAEEPFHFWKNTFRDTRFQTLIIQYADINLMRFPRHQSL